MICLRLVDARQKIALQHHPKTFKTLDACWKALKKLPTWKHGGLRMDGTGGAEFHIWAEAYSAGGVLGRWIFMEVRVIETLVGPDGKALPGYGQVVAGRMEWIGVTEDVAQGFLEEVAQASGGVTP